ncbi:MAG: hypothetical protein C4K49_03660 [Candidatus Thorarchaeota archaeon]|nr:MAG: hypothetical protein C4K49_03660 [Candidatus Thorarchaeota archaeon]
MPARPRKENKVPVFPILRGEAVGKTGEFIGHVVIVSSPKDLKRKWLPDHIAVLDQSLERHFKANPKYLDDLFVKVKAVVAEFGESIGEFAASAYAHDAVGMVKIADATKVLENGMHIRVRASENLGEIFFID